MGNFKGCEKCRKILKAKEEINNNWIVFVISIFVILITDGFAFFYYDSFLFIGLTILFCVWCLRFIKKNKIYKEVYSFNSINMTIKEGEKNMVDKFIVIPTGAKAVSELKFIKIGRTPILDYNAIVTVLNSGKAFVLDATVKEQTARSALKKIKEKLNKGLTVKVRKLEGTENKITIDGKEVVLYQLAFEPIKV
jgi:hypothetical protein